MRRVLPDNAAGSSPDNLTFWGTTCERLYIAEPQAVAKNKPPHGIRARAQSLHYQ